MMPNDVEIYVSPEGEKIHLRSNCAGGNSKKEIINESNFLERLENNKGCKRCCCPDEMIKIIRTDLKKKGR